MVTQNDHIYVDLREDIIEVTIEGGGLITVPDGGGGNSNEQTEYRQDGSLVVGDLVYKSVTAPNIALKVENNKTPNPVIGIVTSVVSPSIVTVSHNGFFDVPSANLIEGAKVYVDGTGKITSELMKTNYVQVLGFAVSDRRIFFTPELKRCRRLEED